jgi:hypothetical protein
MSSKQQEIKTATEAELEQWFEQPLVRRHASQELQRIKLYSEQIAELEKTILSLAQTDLREQIYTRLSPFRGSGTFFKRYHYHFRIGIDKRISADYLRRIPRKIVLTRASLVSSYQRRNWQIRNNVRRLIMN